MQLNELHAFCVYGVLVSYAFVSAGTRLNSSLSYYNLCVFFGHALEELIFLPHVQTAECGGDSTNSQDIQQTEKRYAAMMVLMQVKKSKAIEQPPIPQTIKALPRFIFMTYPWYWIKRMYRSKYFRQFLVICTTCLLAVSVFLLIFLAYDNTQMRRSCLSHICAKR